MVKPKTFFRSLILCNNHPMRVIHTSIALSISPTTSTEVQTVPGPLNLKQTDNESLNPGIFYCKFKVFLLCFVTSKSYISGKLQYWRSSVLVSVKTEKQHFCCLACHPDLYDNRDIVLVWPQECFTSMKTDNEKLAPNQILQKSWKYLSKGFYKENENMCAESLSPVRFFVTRWTIRTRLLWYL